MVIELRVTSFELRVKGWELKVADCIGLTMEYN
ncbi:hypothetical protein BH09BAC1_BH09BAC1_24450 [soil metagenome]